MIEAFHWWSKVVGSCFFNGDWRAWLVRAGAQVGRGWGESLYGLIANFFAPLRGPFLVFLPCLGVVYSWVFIGWLERLRRILLEMGENIVMKNYGCLRKVNRESRGERARERYSLFG